MADRHEVEIRAEQLQSIVAAILAAGLTKNTSADSAVAAYTECYEKLEGKFPPKVRF